jgi:rhamnose utilization protein RhaD (predicted bifunctional aldolase and dehydrogenase)/NAD(P)-dependent dehydrogenase (short-subunit alcohol dehydrogenase family)
MMAKEQIITDRWDDAAAAGLEGLGLLVYQSRLVGSDPRLVVWGGGNTSLKLHEPDFRGRDTYVMRVKGSGSDLKAVTLRDFPAVRMDDVLALFEREAFGDEQMVEYLAHTLMEPNSSRPSIETLLHGFVPARSVVHSHADAILAVTNNQRRAEILAELYGDELAIIPYHRPGFFLSKQVGEAARQRPTIKGVILLNHGLITWADDPREAYQRHIEMVDRAARYAQRDSSPSGGQNPSPTGGGREGVRDALHAPAPSPSRGEGGVQNPSPSGGGRERASAAQLAPTLRGLLTQGGQGQRVVMRFDDRDDVLAFISGATINPEQLPAVLREGAATPDHILNTKRHPLWIDTSDPTDLAAIIEAARQAYDTWVREYTAYYQQHQSGEPMMPAVPRVVLVRGLGMFSVGRDSKAVTIANDIYHHTIAIVEAAERTGGYRSLGDKDAFEAEYWPLELYKLTLAPPEKELARQVALITGAAGAIGAGIARRFASAGAHVVCADLDMDKAEALAEELNKSNPGNRAIAVAMNVTSEASVRAAYRRMLLEYGGLDVLVSNAGIAHSCPIDELTLDAWQRSFAVNATGHFLVAREAMRALKAQGMGGSLVFIATKNVTAPGKDFGAYSAAKAAEAQLARVLALEGGPFGIRSNMVNPDAVFSGSGLWTAEVREERARSYGIAPDQLEDFYRQRNLLRVEVTAEDVAEAALFYAAERSAKTTGSMLPVDGGLREAFPR